MTETDHWIIIGCLMGLCAASLLHTHLYRKMRAEVDFLMVVVPHETESPQ